MTAAGSVGTIETQYLDLPRPVRLDCGRELHPIRVAYETYGTLSPARDNVILVCHALSGDAHAAGFAKTPPPASTRDGFGAEDRDGTGNKGLGWWDGMIGPGKAFDTDRFFVVSTNLLGGCGGTTGPSSVDPTTGKPYGSDFPVITVADMVRTERALLDDARHRAARGRCGRITRRHAGIRMGDPVPRPGRRDRRDRQHPRDPAAGRRVERDRAQRDHGRPRLAGRSLLRQPRAGPTAAWASHGWSATSPTCRRKGSATSSARRLQFADDIRYTLTEPEFEVESYLRHQADTFVRRFDANTYLYTSRALTYFDLARQYGNGSLARALRNVSARTLLIAFSSDWLYPPSGSEELADALRSLGKDVELHIIEAPYGHDCFLLEENRQTPMIQHFLARQVT